MRRNASNWVVVAKHIVILFVSLLDMVILIPLRRTIANTVGLCGETPNILEYLPMNYV